jgi:tRNA uridine 5-carbamoylmethylation protein Kti12
MKRTKEISLNGVDYTLELNRESFIQIDKICNLKKLMSEISKDPYEYVDEIDDDYNPLESTPTIEEIQKQTEEKIVDTKKLYERGFFVWLYPNHKLKISEVQEILKPYFEDSEKFTELDKIFNECLEQCISVATGVEEKN